MRSMCQMEIIFGTCNKKFRTAGINLPPIEIGRMCRGTTAPKNVLIERGVLDFGKKLKWEITNSVYLYQLMQLILCRPRALRIRSTEECCNLVSNCWACFFRWGWGGENYHTFKLVLECSQEKKRIWQYVQYRLVIIF